MFRESLLESSSASQPGKRWPMATAFVVEALVATVLILVPLFSSGIIPVSARVPAAPLHAVALADRPAHNTESHSSSGPHTSYVVTEFAQNENAIKYGPSRPISGPAEDTSDRPVGCVANCVPDGLPDVGPSSALPKLDPPKRIRLSVLSEGQLVHRVEPTYPRMAAIIQLQGMVQLHALIAKDGTIQSLSVISGHPMLATAAIEAVRQWRYRPYILNGEPVEVDTFINVNFKRE